METIFGFGIAACFIFGITTAIIYMLHVDALREYRDAKESGLSGDWYRREAKETLIALRVSAVLFLLCPLGFITVPLGALGFAAVMLWFIGKGLFGVFKTIFGKLDLDD